MTENKRKKVKNKNQQETNLRKKEIRSWFKVKFIEKGSQIKLKNLFVFVVAFVFV